jgi:hypothetical protein
VAEVVDTGGAGPAAATRTRPLAGPDGVVALPVRPARVAGAPAPDPGWLA